MKKPWGKSIYLIIAILLIFSFTAPHAFALTDAELKAQIDAKAKELSDVNKKIQQTQQTLNATTAKSRTLETEINQLDSSIKQVNLNIRSSELLIEKLGLEIDNLQSDIYQKEFALQNKKVSIARLLQQFQEEKDRGLLMAFLNNQTLSDSLDDAQAIEDLNQSLVAEVHALEDITHALSEDLSQVANKKDATGQEAQTLKYKKEIAEDKKQERSVVLNQTKTQQQIYQEQLTKLENERTAIGQEIAKIEASLRASTNSSDLPTKGTGILSYPISDVYITQRYGATEFAQRAYSSKFHNGADFRAPYGTPILAAADGVIKAAGDNGQTQYGKHILIDHANNLTTLYAHLQKQVVTVGQSVKRGQVIGYAGSTGYSTGPHLHFGVYWTPSVQLKQFSGAGLVPVGVTVSPFDYF